MPDVMASRRNPSGTRSTMAPLTSWVPLLALFCVAGLLSACAEAPAGGAQPDAAVSMPPADALSVDAAAVATEVPTGSTLGEAATASGRLHFERPDSVRGLYLNAWSAGSERRLTQLLALADSTEINTFVIDIKDATGFVSHESAVATAVEIGANEQRRIRNLRGLLERLHAHGVYPIARIVVVKDPLLIAARPDQAVQDTAGGVWIDSKDFVWLNLWDRRNLDYHLELAHEVAALGFPEIQWDYIRFPDAPQSDMARAVFPGETGPRPDAVRAFLEAARTDLQAIGVRSTADVFGVTTTFRRDVGIGQVWESFIDVVDAALPMVYPSHYWTGSFGFEHPNARPYEIVREAMADALQRSAAVPNAGEVIPWLQDFSLGQPRYGAPEVRAQIEAVHDAGIPHWILWNPGSRYTAEALRPEGGWQTEPLISYAGEHITAASRFALFERIERERFVADSIAQARSNAARFDSAQATPADSVRAGGC